jgi:hypothetical protein
VCLDVELEADDLADFEQPPGGVGGAPAEARDEGSVPAAADLRVELGRGVQLGGVDPDQPHAHHAVAVTGVERVAVDDALDDDGSVRWRGSGHGHGTDRQEQQGPGGRRPLTHGAAE